MERGQLARLGRFVALGDYLPLAAADVPDASLDLVTCYIGLHHMTAQHLEPFLRSVHRVLRPGGAFIVRDHDVRTDDLRALVSLAHTVFNAGLGETWEANQAERRYFEAAQTWVERLGAAGFDDTGERVLQQNDPTDNTLFCFVRRGAATPHVETAAPVHAATPAGH